MTAELDSPTGVVPFGWENGPHDHDGGDPDVGADLTQLFNYLTGYSRQTTYRSLIVAPHGLRKRLLALIRHEAKVSTPRKPGHIAMKLNGLVDEEIIDALYGASRAGARMDLAVRGICSLRPGVEGLSEGIRVRSILGRFLEHSRIYHFANGEGEGRPA